MGEQDFKLRLSKMIRFTVVERIKEDNMDDPPLPAPTRLNIVYLANLDQQPQNAEFDILAIVVSCVVIKIAGVHGNKCRQIIVMDKENIVDNKI
nr:uncharacterized protein LOC104104343 isoform X2 [Nicotiana tomentosiformis]